jgi:glc operon protein GlcG
MRTRTFAAISLLFLALPGLGVSPLEAQQSLTLEQARIAMDAAEAEARRNQWNLAIVVVDPEGVPIYLRRIDGATARNYEIAMRKVNTALASGMHTVDYAQALAAGRTDSIPNGITFEGGYLIRIGGQLVGAMSASGARGSEDAQVVRAGMAAIGARP